MPPEAILRRVIAPLAAAIILAYFLFFTWRSAGIYFDPDDVLNLYFAWSKPLRKELISTVLFWSDSYRPLGALFYRTIYALAGFNPLPFRIVCLTIGAANIALCFCFIRLVSASGRVAALASLLFAFHPRLLEVWYRTSIVYDLCCFTFVYMAACLYISVRRCGEFPGALRTIAIFTCYSCALDLKEMAVALPVILLVWEILWGRAIWKQLWLTACLALLNLPYIYGKTHGASALVGNPYYQTDYSWSQFQSSWTAYIRYIFLTETITPQIAMGVLVAMLAVAFAARSRSLILAWTIIFFGTLPVSFVPLRGGYALYLSWPGWVLYAAVALVALQDLCTRAFPRFRTLLASAVFIVVGWRFGKITLHEQRTDPRHWLYDPASQVRSMVIQMRAVQPVLPHGAKILFLEDGFSNQEWTPWFIMKLAWHDDSLVIDRLKMMNGRTPDWNAYQYVFTYENGAYRQLRPQTP